MEEYAVDTRRRIKCSVIAPASVNPILYLWPDIKFGGVRRVPASARDNSVEEMGRLTFGRFCQAIHHCKNNKNKTGNIYHIVLFC